MPGLYVMTASGLVAAATPPGPTAAVEAHVADSTNVHGIDDTADLVVTTDERLLPLAPFAPAAPGSKTFAFPAGVLSTGDPAWDEYFYVDRSDSEEVYGAHYLGTFAALTTGVLTFPPMGAETTNSDSYDYEYSFAVVQDVSDPNAVPYTDEYGMWVFYDQPWGDNDISVVAGQRYRVYLNKQVYDIAFDAVRTIDWTAQYNTLLEHFTSASAEGAYYAIAESIDGERGLIRLSEPLANPPHLHPQYLTTFDHGGMALDNLVVNGDLATRDASGNYRPTDQPYAYFADGPVGSYGSILGSPAYRIPFVDGCPLAVSTSYRKDVDADFAYISGRVGFLDADGNDIWSINWAYTPGTMTTLAQPLVAGDTTAVLASGAGWAATGQSLQVWNYVDQSGRSWGPGEYTRTARYVNAVSGNTVTLSGQWYGETVPAGTPVSLSRSGMFWKDIVFAAPNSTWQSQSVVLTGGRLSVAGQVAAPSYEPSPLTAGYPYATAGLQVWFLGGNVRLSMMNISYLRGALSEKVPTSRTITAGTGLTGGGSLAANRTLAADFGATAGKVAQGNDSRITGAAQKSANLSDLASASAARTNLNLGSASLAASGAFATAAQGEKADTAVQSSALIETVMDSLGTAGLVEGANVTLDYDDIAGTITISSTSAPASGGGASAYADLTDVDMTGIADGDVSIWNDTLGVWEPGTLSGSGTAAYVGAKVTRTTNQTIPYDTGTAIIFTTEVWDDGDIFDPAQPSRFTAPVAGKWNFVAYASFLNGEASGQRSLYFTKNGAAAAVGEDDQTTETNGSSAYYNALQSEITFDLDAGEYVEARAYHDRGGGATIRAASLTAHLVSVPANVVTLGPTAWQDYTPTLTATPTSPTLGTGGVISGRYRVNGNHIEGSVYIKFGSSGVTAGSGAYSISLPAGVALAPLPNVNSPLGSAWCYDTSSGLVRVLTVGGESATSVRLYIDSDALVNHDKPWVWAAEDVIALKFSGEITAGGGYSGVDIKQHERMSWTGNVVVGAIPFALYNTDGVARTIDSVHVGVTTAPTGAPIVVNVLKNGTTIYPTTAKPTVAASALAGSSVPDTVAWAAGEYLTLDVTSVGSTVAGANMVVTVTYH